MRFFIQKRPRIDGISFDEETFLGQQNALTTPGDDLSEMEELVSITNTNLLIAFTEDVEGNFDENLPPVILNA